MIPLLTSMVVLAADGAPRPLLIGSVRVSTYTGLPDVLGVSGSVHLIPWVDLEGGAAAFVLAQSWYVRGGPRWLFEDWRNDAQVGPTLRLSALFGFKAVATTAARFQGFHFVGAVEFTWWLASHFGLTAQLTGGGTVRTWPVFFPELRLALGVAF